VNAPNGASGVPGGISDAGSAGTAVGQSDNSLRVHGQFSEEREALAIDALLRLGRRSEAQARARAFLQRYPSSSHRERVGAALR
jgi:hypothetical protein